MKNILLVILSVFAINSSFADHIQAGYISYRHITEYQYEVTVTVYKDEFLPADPRSVEIRWGDENEELRTTELYRTNREFINLQEVIKYGFKFKILKDTYTGIHTYPGPGSYLISSEIGNRNSGLINIPDKGFFPMSLETGLIIYNENGYSVNNSPVFYTEPFFIAAFKNFGFNLSAEDPDGDILTYKLINVKGEEGEDAEGYEIPLNAPIDPVTGKFSYTEDRTGKYVFAIMITECRDNKLMGNMVFDFTLFYNPVENIPVFTARGNEEKQIFRISPGEEFVLPVEFSRSRADTVQLEFSGKALSLSKDPPVFEETASSEQKKEFNFRWKPSAEAERCAPYIFSARGLSAKNSVADFSFAVFVGNLPKEICDCNPTGEPITRRKRIEAKVFPNPFSHYTIIDVKPIREKHKNYTVSVYDLLGRHVRELRVNHKGRAILFKEDLAAGKYFLVLKDEEGGIIQTFQVIILRETGF
jgi:hypothetical protein